MFGCFDSALMIQLVTQLWSWHQRTRMVETTKIDRTEELSLFRFGFDDSACHTAMGFPGLASLAEMIDMGLASADLDG